MPRPPIPYTPGPMGVSEMQGNPGIWISAALPTDHGLKHAGNPGQGQARASRPTAQSRPGAVGVQVDQRPGEHHRAGREPC